MNASKDSLLFYIDRLPSSSSKSLAIDMLKDPSTRTIDECSVGVRVGEVKSICKVRLHNSLITGRIIYGARHLIETLYMFDDDLEIQQFSFLGGAVAGNIYFDDAETLLGLFLVGPTNRD